MVDEASLVLALEEDKVRGAWLDTFSIEPYNGPLKKYPQVVLTPVEAGYVSTTNKVNGHFSQINIVTNYRKDSGLSRSSNQVRILSPLLWAVYSPDLRIKE